MKKQDLIVEMTKRYNKTIKKGMRGEMLRPDDVKGVKRQKKIINDMLHGRFHIKFYILVPQERRYAGMEYEEETYILEERYFERRFK